MYNFELIDTCDGVLVLSELSMWKVWSADVPYANAVIYQQGTTTKINTGLPLDVNDSQLHNILY
jgi:hypothetical protein